ncbi:L,D-transpeptidase [Amorphus coralli]|uniref:L,D-transpeptidase n=1 Tax=Amorphus coralli TaxID=340680 RepID=UPI000374719E|nr:L,D-transpeptidase [Amorphus coralli]
MTAFGIRRLLTGAILGLGVALVAAAPTHAEERIYDPSSGSWITYDPARLGQGTTSRNTVPKKFRKTIVDYPTDEAPGTIIVDTQEKFLFLVEPGGKAIRYGVGVGKEGFAWAGQTKIGRKAEWPSWTPTKNMIKRDPELKKYAGGMPGGINNPLGARALYLYTGGRDSLYRIHGTNAPWSIGQNVSSGCIRMNNADVEDLYTRAKVGAKVVVRHNPGQVSSL